MIDLTHGVLKSRLRSWCLEQVILHQERWPLRRAILLVPEQGKMEMERDFLAQAKGVPLMLAEVLSFRRLAWRVLGEIGIQTENAVDKVGQAILIQKILREHKKHLTVFGPLSEHPGFIRDVASVLGDFKRYQISAELLRGAAERCEDEALSRKTHDFAVLLSAYEKALVASHLADGEDDLRHLAALLQTLASEPESLRRWPHDRLSWLKETSFWVNGFGEQRALTPQEVSVLKALDRLGAKLTITLAADHLPADAAAVEQGPDAFLPGRKTAWQLRQQFPIGKTFSLAAKTPPLGQRLLDRSTRPLDESQAGYRLIWAPDAVQEVAWVAGEIRRLIHEEGYRCRDIVLAVCDLPAYTFCLKATFRRYDLPLFLDSQRNLGGSPLMRLVLSILDMGLHGWSRSNLMRFLRCGLLPIQSTSLDRLENHWLQWGLFREDRLFDRRYDDPERGIDADLPSQRDALLKPVRQLLTALGKSPLVADKARHLQDYLLAQKVPQAIEGRSEHLMQQGELEEAVFLTQSWNELDRVLSQMTRLAANESISQQSFRDSLNAGMEAAQTSIIPTAIDQVSVGDLRRGALREPKALFILGAAAGKFPPAWPAEGLLKDQDRQTLAESLGQELPSHASDQAFADQFMLHTLLTLPQKRLYVSGAGPEASSWFSWLATLHPPSLTRLKETLSIEDPRLHAPRPAFAYWLSRSGAAGLADEAFLAGLKETLKTREDLPWSRLPDWKEAAQNRLWVQLTPEQVAMLYQGKVTLSVSQLQSYAACPFQHWGSSLLQLQARPEMQPQLTEMGIVLHSMAEKAMRQLRDELISAEGEQRQSIIARWLASDLASRARDWFFQATEAGELIRFREKGLMASVSRKAMQLLCASFAGMLRQLEQEKYLPQSFEWRFGPQTPHPYTIEPAGLAPIELAGTVDRIDYEEGDPPRYRIIDYKSGRQGVQYDALYHGLHLQLPLYLAAYQKHHPQHLAAEAAYFHFDHPILKQAHGGDIRPETIEKEMAQKFRMQGFSLDSEQFAALCRHSEAKAAQFGQRLLSGSFAASPAKIPKENPPCDWCALGAFCRFDIKGGDYRHLAPLKQALDQSQSNKKDAFFDYLATLQEDTP